MSKWHTRLGPLIWSVGLLTVAAAIFLPEWLYEGSGLRFESPWFLLGLLAWPLVITAGLVDKLFAGRLRFSVARMLTAVGPGLRARLLPVSVGLRATAVVFLVVALARPQDSTRREETEMEGIDIVLTIDVSMSMKAEDLEPTRLAAAKEVVLDFVERRRNDRIGAVIFAENAYTLCPLTLAVSRAD